MAIVIPSKNIYSINFDPVIDNQIDKVEFTEKQASIVESQEEVAKQTITNFVDGNPFTIEKLNGFNDGRDIDATYIQVTDIKYTPTITINIDKKQNNKLIKSLFTGVDGNGNSNISYELFGDVQKGQVYIVLLVTGSGNNLTVINSEINIYPTEISTQDTTYSFSINNNHKYKSSMEFPVAFKTASVPANNDLSTELEIDGGTIFSTKAIETETQFSISLNLLAGFTLYKAPLTYANMEGSNYRLVTINPPSTLNTKYYPYFEKYIAKKVNITINGTVLSLNLEDDTIQKGNGNKVFSFDGNELIQTTNTPTQESKYQGVINEWKDGKQTAIITCSIDKYRLDEPVTLKLVNTSNPSGNTYSCMLSGTPAELGKIKKDYYLQGNGFHITISYVGNRYAQGKITEEQGGNFPNYGADFNAEGYKMNIFDIGDIVIPYTYTNQGDKPISYNKDFTPKQFKIVGTKIMMKQGVLQELTLQEV